MTRLGLGVFHHFASSILWEGIPFLSQTPPGHIGASIQRVVVEHLHAGERPRDYSLPLVPTLHVCVVTLHSRAEGASPHP
jgi:hypothetical protein